MEETMVRKTDRAASKRLQSLIDSISLTYGSVQDVYDSGNDKDLPSGSYSRRPT
jgi:hypothetical protein